MIELASWPASISHRLTKTQQLTDAADEPLPTGFPPAPGGFGPTPIAPGIQTGETIYEVNYKLSAADGVILTPDLQYIEYRGALDSRRPRSRWAHRGRFSRSRRVAGPLSFAARARYATQRTERGERI